MLRCFSVIAYFTGHLRVRLDKTTKPRAPGTLQLQKTCQGEHSTAPALLPPHPSASLHPCALHLSKWLLLLLCFGLGFCLRLGLRKQSLDLQGFCKYKRHAKVSTLCHPITFDYHYFIPEFSFISLNWISFYYKHTVISLFHFLLWFQDFISFPER